MSNFDDTLTPEEEKIITKLIAATFGFEVREKGVTCKFCNARFQEYSIGKHMTDRMITHARKHGIGHDLHE